MNGILFASILDLAGELRPCTRCEAAGSFMLVAPRGFAGMLAPSAFGRQHSVPWN